MSLSYLKGAIEWPLMVALVFGAGAVAQAQNEEGEPGGPVIQIGKSDGEDGAQNIPVPNEGLARPNFGGGIEQPEAPKYWIGLAGGAIPADHVLRAHVDIPEGQGLLVASVVPDGPAAKAGVKQHDILLRANDIELNDMQNLVELVLSEGEKKGQIALEVLRRGERETVFLKPEERPADAPRPQADSGFGGGGFGGFGGGGDLPEQLRPFMQEFGGRIPFEFRNFGPGVIVGGGGGFGAAELPNGVSVNIHKEAGKPTRITVQRGDETWEVTGDDQESLNQLPEDLRPMVEQMLHGGGPANFNFGGDGQGPMPEFGDGRLRERLERMEKRMQELMERFEQRPDAQQENAEQAN
jgi:hypothetical protein